MHSKLTENKIPHYELLLYKGKEQEKRKEQIQKEKQRKLDEQLKTFQSYKRGKPSKQALSKVENKTQEYEQRMFKNETPELSSIEQNPQITSSKSIWG